MIQITLEKSEYALGEVVRGDAVWTPEKDCKPRKIITKLCWRTSGRGDEDSADYSRVDIDVGEARQGMSVPLSINLDLPLQAPLSYEGRLITIFWEVCVQVDLPFAFDEKHAERIRVMSKNAEQQA